MDTQNSLHQITNLFVKSILLILFYGIHLLQSSSSFAQISVNSVKDGQLFPSAVHDGKGGVIVVWEDYRTGNDWDVYAQRLDQNNTLLWEMSGIPISVADRNQRRLRMIPHDTHAIVVWNDRRGIKSWDIYAQAIGHDGDVLWQADGIPICTNSADQSTQAILGDDDGGAVLVWEDERRSSEFQDLYIQRIDFQGKPMWKKDGIPVLVSESLQSDPILAADGLGGFYVIWWDVIGYDSWHIMAQRFNFSGTHQWDSPILISPADGMQGLPRVVSDGTGGFIVVWQIYENFINDQLYAQRISPNGKKVWEDAAIPICTADGIQKNHAIVEDGHGGTIVVWRDERDFYGDLYMQRIHADGTLAWEKDGIPLCTEGGHQDRPFIVRTVEDEFFVAWIDYRGDIGETTVDALYCQKIDIDGKLLREKDGVPISKSKGEHFPPFVVSVGNGQSAVVWSNSQRDNGDIFLKRF